MVNGGVAASFSPSHPGPQEGLGGRCIKDSEYTYTYHVCIGLWLFLWYLRKSKNHTFSFSPELSIESCDQCFILFCHYFPRNFMIPSSPNFLPLWTKSILSLLQSSRKWIFFPLWESCKDQNEWNTKLKCLIDHDSESELPNQTVTVLPQSLKKHAILCSPDGRLYIFC